MSESKPDTYDDKHQEEYDLKQETVTTRRSPYRAIHSSNILAFTVVCARRYREATLSGEAHF
jgi:hypothetical protein